MIFHEDIENLCGEYTDLMPDDIGILLETVKELPLIVERENVDCFIDCLCRNPHEAVNAAVCLRDDTEYMFSTMGYIIRDSDEPAVFRSLIHGVDTNDVLAICYVTTENNRMVQNTSPIKNGDKTVGVLIREHRYVRRDEAAPETACTRNAVPRKDADIESVEWLGESVDDAVIILDNDKRVVYRNRAAKEIYRDFGYLHDMLGDDYLSYSIHGDLLVGPGAESASFEVSSKGYFLVKQFYFPKRQYPYLITIRDITALKQSSKKLVVESEALRETHHRIKNNLQTIYSLLDLQRRRVESGELASILQDTMNRIISISVSYEPLLAHGGDSLSVREVITKLAENFSKQMDESTSHIEIVVAGDDVYASLDTCTSIAMVVNELIQNSLKYAFAGFAKGDVGRVDILISDSPLYTSIAVTDNGSGFAQDGGRGGRPESAHTGAAAPHHAPSHSDAAPHHASSHSDAAPHHTGAAAPHHAPSHSDAAPSTNDAPASGSAAGLGLSIVRNIVGSKLGGHLEVHSGETGTSVTFDFKHEERRETPSPRKLKAVKETL